MLAAHLSLALHLPDFLVPALRSTRQGKSFSISSQCRSRIGSESLSLPPGVNVQILDPSVPKRKIVSMTESPKVVEVEGPLGTLNNTC